MSYRSKRVTLLAAAVAPALSLSVITQPTFAQTPNPPILMAQNSEGEPSGDMNLQQQQEEELRRAEEEARQATEEQQRAAEEENRRQADEQRRAAQEESDRQAQEQQRASEEAQREAAEQQRAAEQQKSNEEELRKQSEQALEDARLEAEKQLQEQEKIAEKAKRQAAQQQADMDQQKAIEEEARKKAAEEAAKQESEQLRSVESTDTPTEEGEPATPAPEPQAPSSAADEPIKKESAPEQPASAPEKQEIKNAQPSDENDAPKLPEQPVEQPTTNPSQAIIDERSNAENQEIAKDPSKTDDTVVLPVENGAAILDSDKDADNRGGEQSRKERRMQREKNRAAEQNVSLPTDDANAQVEIPQVTKDELSKKLQHNLEEKGERVEQAPAFAFPGTTNIINNTVINNNTVNNTTVNNNNLNSTNVQVVEQLDNRVILDAGDRVLVRGDDRPRLRRDAERSYYDELPGGRMRETIVRPGGYEIVTVYDRYGDIIQRNRIDSAGENYLMIYTPDYDDTPGSDFIDVGYELPPMRLTVPIRDYIIDVADDPDRDFYDFLARPPVERVERVYTINEVRHSARLRDKVRRIDLDTIHFTTGSSEVSLSQAKTLRKVADAMNKVLQKDPGETFFIEGHTDAVGSDLSNLILSDKRAESVASLLTEVYDIPAENLVTQGYGERFLKVRTQSAEQENRRVTIRRVTPLVRPVAQR
ncbi:OmpA family protein [Brucella sp. 21LCYQ03]|nr:OmpA family protein [Brucella sp. 21LCYQ03]